MLPFDSLDPRKSFKLLKTPSCLQDLCQWRSLAHEGRELEPGRSWGLPPLRPGTQ